MTSAEQRLGLDKVLCLRIVMLLIQSEEVYTEGAEDTLKTTTSSGQSRCEYRLIPHGTHALNKP